MSSRNKLKVSENDDFNKFEIIEREINSKLLEKNDDPFFICNLDDVLRKIEKWNFELPRVKPYFAIKCNNNEHIPKILALMGSGFDCASRGEIQKILDLGVNPDRIIFANTIKQYSHIEFARNVGVSMMTFDCAEELRKISKIYPQAKVVLRIRCDSKKSVFSFGEKFGCDEQEARELILLSKDLKINLIGVSFHAGPVGDDFDLYNRTLKIVSKLFQFAKVNEIYMNLVDIGGGFCGKDLNSLNMNSEVINSVLETCFPDPSIKVIAEPGRYFVTSSTMLVCNIITKKIKRTEDGSIEHISYYLNDSMHNSFSTDYVELFSKVPINVNARSENRPKYLSSFYGNTCDSDDKILSDIEWEEAFMGEWVLFEDMGAYSDCMATSFNGFSPTSCVSYIQEKKR